MTTLDKLLVRMMRAEENLKVVKSVIRQLANEALEEIRLGAVQSGRDRLHAFILGRYDFHPPSGAEERLCSIAMRVEDAVNEPVLLATHHPPKSNAEDPLHPRKRDVVRFSMGIIARPRLDLDYLTWVVKFPTEVHARYSTERAIEKIPGQLPEFELPSYDYLVDAEREVEPVYYYDSQVRQMNPRYPRRVAELLVGHEAIDRWKGEWSALAMFVDQMRDSLGA